MKSKQNIDPKLQARPRRKKQIVQFTIKGAASIPGNVDPDDVMVDLDLIGRLHIYGCGGRRKIKWSLGSTAVTAVKVFEDKLC